jgi:hypothetical protein
MGSVFLKTKYIQVIIYTVFTYLWNIREVDSRWRGENSSTTRGSPELKPSRYRESQTADGQNQTGMCGIDG